MSVRRAIVLVTLFALSSLTLIAQRWERVNLPKPFDNAYYLDVYFLPSNPQYGWAVDQHHGYVIRTTDGGRSWSGDSVKQDHKDDCHLEWVQFLDENLGYCSGPCGIYKSIDGGHTWTADLRPDNVSTWGGWFRNATEGWVTGGGICGRNVFLKTVDGGANWTKFVDSSEKNSKMTDPLWLPGFPAGVVYAIGSGLIWVSDDDGATWAPHVRTGTTSPWHEELAMNGASICVPSSGTGCNGANGTNGGTGGGIRTSDNNGVTWRDFNTGQPMYGTFLVTPRIGWASGYNRSVYYTGDAGNTWELRNCGIEPNHHLDDIFFINDSTGWVVGDGVYRLAPPLRTVSDSALVFAGVCPDSTMRDTIRVRNINFFASPWSMTISGPDADLFKIGTAALPTISGCADLPVIIEYSARRPGLHTAILTITFGNPSATLIVTLTGDKRDWSAFPADTVVTYSARVGTPVDRQLLWRSRLPSYETIVGIQRVSGDTTISLNAVMPALVGSGATETMVRATLQDTGWHQARFLVRLAPCMRDTFITVRVYGLSPIFSSVASAQMDAACRNFDTLRIPVRNTGNDVLTISGVRFEGLGTLAFSALKWSSGAVRPPVTIRIGQADTLYVLYTPVTTVDNANLVIEHNDFTRTRGIMTPWNIALRAASRRVEMSVTPSTIDLGTLCIGQIGEREVTFGNSGVATASVTVGKRPTALTGFPSSQFFVNAKQKRVFNLRYTASEPGDHVDTLQLRVSPCDTVLNVIVKVRVVALRVDIQPRSLNVSVPSGMTSRQTVAIRILQAPSATINSISLRPPHPDASLEYDMLPKTLPSSDSLVVTVVWTGTGDVTHSAFLVVEAEEGCRSFDSIPVTLQSYSQDVDLSKRSLSMMVRCIAEAVVDSVVVTNKGQHPLTVSAPVLAPADQRLTIVAPTQSFTLVPGGSKAVVVRYVPTVPGGVATSLQLQLQPGDRSISIPLTARFDDARLSMDPSMINFDTVFACGNERQLSVIVKNAGTLDDMFDVIRTNSIAGVSVAPSAVQVAAGGEASLLVTCTPAQVQNGTWREKVVVRSRTCSTEVTFDIMVVASSARLNVTPSRIDVGTVGTGIPATRTVTIDNTGDRQHRITSIRIDPSGSPWSCDMALVNTVVSPGDRPTMDVRLLSSTAGSYPARLTITEIADCEIVHVVELHGDVVVPSDTIPPTHRIVLHMNDYQTSPVKGLEMPVYWDADVRDAELDSVRIHIEFSRLHYVMDTILPGSMRPGVVSTSYVPGAIDIAMRRDGERIGEPGILCVLRGEVFAALPDSTPFLFADVRPYSTMATQRKEEIVVSTEPGSLIVDVCGPRFLIRFGSVPVMRFEPPHPSTDIVRVHVDADREDFLSYEITDATGNVVVRETSWTIPAGSSDLDIPVRTLSTGVYGIRLWTGRGGTLSGLRAVVH